MALTPGTRLGPYEILSALGAGGMGVVYRARDSKLNRDVALKVLLPEVADNPERLARFRREAQILASLNHQNIGHIYGLEESDGVVALVMELVEGDDLSQRIARGAIPVDEALPIAKQIAEALEAAHEQGIIHRDLKPANIKVRADGTVKVLDFGLAKAVERSGERSGSGKPGEAAGVHSPGPHDLSASPTITSPAMLTGAGMILGTAAYMSPEQAKGRPVDRRADVWAFGVVLFEMLTGTRAFEGEGISETLARVIAREPDWSRLPPTLSPALRTYLERCLRKDPRQRIRDIGDVRLALEGAFEVVAQHAATPPSSTPRTRLAWIVAAALLAAATMTIPTMRHLGETPPALAETRLQVVTPATADPLSFALSPDGRQLVFVASDGDASRLWHRSLDSTNPQPLAGTDGASFPFWSPDSKSVCFFADGLLKRLDLGAGAPRTLTAAYAGRGGTWNADGVIVFGPDTASPLFRVSAAGGPALPVTRLDRQASHRFPVFLPGGRRFVFFAQSGSAETGGIFLGLLDGSGPVRLTPADGAGAFLALGDSPDGARRAGRLLWVNGGVLVAQTLDLERRVLTGDPRPLAEGVAVNSQFSLAPVSVSSVGLWRIASARRPVVGN